jgi:ABC-type sugar transport system permease subunit
MLIFSNTGSLLVYRTGFFGFNLGGAAALSVMLLVALNALQLRGLRRDRTR